MGDLAPFVQECINELVDVLWLVRLSPDTSPKDVSQMLNMETGLGTLLPVGELLFCKTAGCLGQHTHDGLFHSHFDR